MSCSIQREARLVVYRYGALAWFWRGLIALGLFGGGSLLVLAVHFRSVGFLFTALPLLLPSLFCGWVVATSVEVEGNRLRVATLLFVRRLIPVGELGRPKVRLRATAVTHQVDAPRLWVPVRGRAPIYLDLYAHIPDRAAFLGVFPLSPAVASVLDDDHEVDPR